MLCPFCQEEIRIGYMFVQRNPYNNQINLCRHGCCSECLMRWHENINRRVPRRRRFTRRLIVKARCPNCRQIIDGFRRYADVSLIEDEEEGGILNPIVLDNNA